VVEGRAGEALGVGDPLRAARFPLGRHLQRPGQRIVGQLVDQADGVGLLAGEGQAAQDDLQGLCLAHHARQTLRAAAAREDADASLGQADGGDVGQGDPQVASQAELEAAAHAEAVDGGHHRLRSLEDLVDQGEETVFRPACGLAGRRRRVPGGVAHVGELAHVVVADEDVGEAAGDDHTAHGGVGGEWAEGLQHLLGAGGGHRAQRRVGVGHHRGSAAPFHGHQAHGVLLLLSWRKAWIGSVGPTRSAGLCASSQGNSAARR